VQAIHARLKISSRDIIVHLHSIHSFSYSFYFTLGRYLGAGSAVAGESSGGRGAVSRERGDRAAPVRGPSSGEQGADRARPSVVRPAALRARASGGRTTGSRGSPDGSSGSPARSGREAVSRSRGDDVWRLDDGSQRRWPRPRSQGSSDMALGLEATGQSDWANGLAAWACLCLIH
jgi:hypothetical protein